MSTAAWLRVASVLTLLNGIGHSMGAPWTPASGLASSAVLELMKSYDFPLQGFTRTYWDFYVGFGAVISVLLFALAVLLWQLSALARTDAARVRPIVATFLAAFAANAVLAALFFFAVPLVLSLAIAATLGAAFLSAGQPAGA